MKKLYFLCLTVLVTSLSFGQVVINEIDSATPGTDVDEFIELKGTPNASLDGLVVVLYNGSNDQSYAAFDLDGKTLDANGFFILGNTGIISGSDIDLGASNALQNGADAVAIYAANDTDFPPNTPVTSVNLIDALVYGTSDADDAELLAGLGETVQYDENLNGTNDTESLQLNAAGTAYETKPPTFRASNDSAVCELSLTSTSALCDAFTVGTDTYTVTVDFVGGGTSTYTVSSDFGSVDLSAGNPSVDATGTITVTGLSEGTDVVITVQDGALCDLSATVTSPVCEPSNTLPLYEGFDYTVGQNLNDQANWSAINGGDDILIGGPGGLTYTGLANSSQTGNHIAFDGGGMESKLEFTPASSGFIYASFIFNVTDISAITDLTDGGYFAALSTSDTAYDLRVWARPNPDASGSTFDLAVTTLSSSPTFSAGTYSTGTNIFIVMSYDLDTGNIQGWINPASGTFSGTAPAPDFTELDSAPPSTLDRFIIRQDSTGETPFILFDELRIGTTWADVTPTTLSTEDFTADRFKVYPNPTSTGYVNIMSANNDNVSVAVYDILGKQVINTSLTNDRLNVSALNAGVYILKITQNNASVTKKLVIK